MKKLMMKNKYETAQVIPLVVLAMFAIIGMVALILDGGSIMSNRRTAQAAADAGALAGAKQLCSPDTAPNAISVAQDYAKTNNKASTAIATAIQVTINGHTVNGVNVKTSVENPSFFAGIFGVSSLKANAEASAGCYHPSVTTHMLPIAFYYNTPPVKAKTTDCSTAPCSLVNWDYTELLTALETAKSDPSLLPYDDLYVVSDKTKVCEKSLSGTIVCTDMAANASGGNRTWIDLSKVADTSNLKKVIKDGISKPLALPSWLNGEPGAVSAVYDGTIFSELDPIKNYEDLQARLVLVPVFSDYCPSGNPQTDCSSAWKTGDRINLIVNSNQPSYRLVGLAPFVVTCVTKSGKGDFGQTNAKGDCPGNAEIIKLDPKDKNTIEGYFVDGSPLDDYTGGTEGVSAGLDVISLTK